MIRSERVTTALLAMLELADGVPTGDHGTTRPDPTTGQQASMPTVGQYRVLWRIDGGAVTGSLADPAEDATLVYQVDSHGRSRQQAEGLADRTAITMTAMSAAGGHVQPLAGSGWRANLRTRQVVGAPTPEGTDETGVPLWTVRDRYEVEVVRA